MTLSREQGNNIKGWAIIFIALANMFRHIVHLTSNEMAWYPAMTQVFKHHAFTAASPVYSIGFLGWYGVVMFLFLSGFGLYRKYGDTLDGASLWTFLKKHAVKLWKLMVPPMLLYVLLDGVLFNNWENYTVGELARQALFVINFLDFNHLTPGTYWFFGLIMQFYLLYAVLFRRLGTRTLVIIAVAALVLLYLNLYLSPESASKWVRHNFVGWIAPFTLGVIFAKADFRLPSRRVAAITSVLCWLLFLVSAVVKSLFPLSEWFLIVASVTLVVALPCKPVAFVGRISSSVFVLYPLVQLVISPYLKADASLIIWTAIYLAGTILVATVHYYLMRAKKRH